MFFNWSFEKIYVYTEAQQLINLEIGNRPQIYEVLDDSLNGIDLQNHNGDVQ